MKSGLIIYYSQFFYLGTRPVILQTDHNYSEWSNFQDNNDLDEGLGPANLGDVDVVSGRADSVSFEDYLGAVDSNGGSTRVKRAVRKWKTLALKGSLF